MIEKNDTLLEPYLIKVKTCSEKLHVYTDFVRGGQLFFLIREVKSVGKF